MHTIIDPKTKEVFVHLDNNDLKYARELAIKFCKYHEWGDKASVNTKTYSQGVLNTPTDNNKTERIGVYGEMAFSHLTGLPIDDKKKERGNKYDFITKDNIKLEAKCSLILYPYCFIKAIHENGYEIPLNSDYYFFSYIYEQNKNERNATSIVIKVHGFFSKKDILKNKKERIVPALSPKYNWKNYKIEFNELTHPLTFLRNF